MADPMKLAMTVSLIDKLTAPAKKVKNSVAGITAGIDDTAVAAKRASERINKVQGKVRNFGARMLRFGFGLSAAGYGFKRAFVDTAAQFEKFETVLETIEGSSEKARQSMQWVSDFAAKTPYELAEVNDAFVKLRAYGMDPTSGLMRTLGDTSSAMGKPIMQAVEAGTALKSVAAASVKADEYFRERGIAVRTLDEAGRLRSFAAVVADMRRVFGAEIDEREKAVLQEAYRSEYAARVFMPLLADGADVRRRPNCDTLTPKLRQRALGAGVRSRVWRVAGRESNARRCPPLLVFCVCLSGALAGFAQSRLAHPVRERVAQFFSGGLAQLPGALQFHRTLCFRVGLNGRADRGVFLVGA